MATAPWRSPGGCRPRAGRSPAPAAARRGAPSWPRSGIEAWLFDREQPLADPTAALAGSTHLLSSVPPDAAGDPVLDLCGPAIAARRDLAWVGYLSTTGVYGDRDGGWVDETSALTPSGERGRRRVAAESGWLGSVAALPVHIFRLAGIYGPGRSAFDSLRAGRAQRIDKPGQVFSRIHVEDIARTLRASMAEPNPGAVYNLCDDDPAPPADVIAYAAGLLGVAPPPLIPFAEAKLSEMARSFYDDNKRVRNDRIKRELGVQLAYPDYRAGLAAILKAEKRRAEASSDGREEARQILGPGQAVVAVLDQLDHRLGARQDSRPAAGRSDRARRDRACHAAGAPGRRARWAGAAGDDGGPPRPAVGDGDQLALIGRGGRELAARPRSAGACSSLEAVPDQILGEIRGRGDADQAPDAIRPGKRGQEGDPAAHAGADQDLGPLGQLVDHGQGILGPAADGAGAEIAGGGAMAEIVEAQEGMPAGPAMLGQSALAFVPPMSERNPGKNTIPGGLTPNS